MFEGIEMNICGIFQVLAKCLDGKRKIGRGMSKKVELPYKVAIVGGIKEGMRIIKMLEFEGNR